MEVSTIGLVKSSATLSDRSLTFAERPRSPADEASVSHICPRNLSFPTGQVSRLVRRTFAVRSYRRRDRGLLLVPWLTILRTHVVVRLDRPAGSTQMTFE